MSIALLQTAARLGWRLRPIDRNIRDAPVPRFVDAMHRPAFLPLVSYIALAVAVAIYASAIVVEMTQLRSDIRFLTIVLLALSVALLGLMRVKPLNVVEKGVLYIAATVLVYLDSVVLPGDRPLAPLCWTAVAVAAVATAIRLRLYNDRRFQLTPLDLIVLFMALVVPSLPDTLGLPHGGALAIAKLVILFYAIEMLVSRSESNAVWVRIAATSFLAALTLRSLGTT
jgi:UDP-GlcNAc:undecaprenyl-phosphate GlcNAc-1-phosphate transferase